MHESTEFAGLGPRFFPSLNFDELVKSKNHAIRWLSKNTDIQGVVFCGGS